MEINAVQFRANFFKLLNEVQQNHKEVIITKRGKPMARLVPMSAEPPAHLGDNVGWADDDDPFFARLEAIIAERDEQASREPSLGD